MVSQEEAKLQPYLYSGKIDINQSYVPVFYDGWTPNLSYLALYDPQASSSSVHSYGGASSSVGAGQMNVTKSILNKMPVLPSSPPNNVAGQQKRFKADVNKPNTTVYNYSNSYWVGQPPSGGAAFNYTGFDSMASVNGYLFIMVLCIMSEQKNFLLWSFEKKINIK